MGMIFDPVTKYKQLTTTTTTTDVEGGGKKTVVEKVTESDAQFTAAVTEAPKTKAAAAAYAPMTPEVRASVMNAYAKVAREAGARATATVR